MTQSTVRGVAAATLLGLAGVLSGPSDGRAQDRIACGGELYTVSAGDSLSAIAQRAYSSFNYQLLYEANRDVLDSAAVLIVGQKLFVPCLDGSGRRTKAETSGGAAAGEAADPAADTTASPVTRQALVREEADPLALLIEEKRLADEASQAEEARTVRQARAAAAAIRVAALDPANQPPALPTDDRPIRFLTGSNYAPYSDRDLPEGGMITEIVNRAMQRADRLRFYEITWQNDWDRHVSELLPSGAHDLGFPWFRPDCSAPEMLSEAMRLRCTDFDFSEPLYEVVIGYYVRSDDAARRARDPEALFGKRLCRPAGSFVFDLETAGLIEPNVTLVEPGSAADCIAMLAAGEADAVSMNASLAGAEIAAQGVGGQIAEARGLATTETLHVIAPKSNPYGRGYIALIDDGIRRLRDEGVWFEVTSRHLSEHARLN